MNRTTFLKSALLGICTLVAASCSDTPLATDDSIDATSGNPSKGPSVLVANANPAIVFVSSVPTGKKTAPVPAIKVMDADGSDTAAVFIGPSGTIFRMPRWAPTGNGTASSPWSISFTQDVGGSTGNTYLKRINVWVESGVVKYSTPTTLVQYATSSGKAVRLAAWSPSTTANEIVYTEVSLNGSSAGRLLVIPASGGTSTELLPRSTGQLAWNADGSKLAFTNISSGGAWQITIIDRASPSTQRSIVAGQHNQIDYLDWSRSGSNMIAYGATSGTSSTMYLYTTNVSDATPTPSAVLSNSQPVAGTAPTWSPDNTRLVYSSSGLKTVTLSSGMVTTLSTSSGSMPDWRR